MGLKRYDVTIPGRGGDKTTTLLLSDEEAKRQGVLKDKAAKPAAAKARTPQNKARKPATKTDEATDPGASEA